MIPAILAMSSCRNLANCSGVSSIVTYPSASNRFFVSGVAIACRTAASTLSRTAFGVAAGSSSPYHVVSS
jgi:hypothetical protein